MAYFVFKFGAILLSLTAILMIKSFNSLVSVTKNSGKRILGYELNENYKALGNFGFLKTLWNTSSFTEYEKPIKESLIKARFLLRFQVIGIVVWVTLSLIL